MHTCKIDSSVRIALVQFKFNDLGSVPTTLKQAQPESEADALRRKRLGLPEGTIVVPSEENVAIGDIMLGLEGVGYRAVHAYVHIRQQRGNPKKTYPLARFVFKRSDAVPDQDLVSHEIKEAFDSMCRHAFWRVRVFSNPFIESGKLVENARSINLDLDGRISRNYPTGQPVLARRKDAEGRKYGDPVPIEPQRRLVVESGALALI